METGQRWAGPTEAQAPEVVQQRRAPVAPEDVRHQPPLPGHHCTGMAGPARGAAAPDGGRRPRVGLCTGEWGGAELQDAK